MTTTTEIAILAICAALFFGLGWYEKGIHVEASLEKAQVAQEAANEKKSLEVNLQDQKTQTVIESYRRQLEDYQSKWSQIHAEKTHAVCQLDPRIIRLLEADTAN